MQRFDIPKLYLEYCSGSSNYVRDVTNSIPTCIPHVDPPKISWTAVKVRQSNENGTSSTHLAIVQSSLLFIEFVWTIFQFDEALFKAVSDHFSFDFVLENFTVLEILYFEIIRKAFNGLNVEQAISGSLW